MLRFDLSLKASQHQQTYVGLNIFNQLVSYWNYTAEAVQRMLVLMYLNVFLPDFKHHFFKNFSFRYILAKLG